MNFAQDPSVDLVDSLLERVHVSVILIFLDAGQFIREAIDSVFAQTYKAWELLLVDDGSVDGATQIARECAARYPGKVRYLDHPGHENRGMSASRNLGISHATGDYVAFVDADDVWLPDKLERQVAILDSHPQVEMVIGPVQWWYSWTGNPDDEGRDFVTALNVGADSVVEPPRLLIRLLKKDTVTTTLSLIRLSTITRLGGFEENFRGLYEDQAFFAKVSSSSAVYVDTHCSYKWRKHSGSSCAQAAGHAQYRSARLKFLMWLQHYLSEQGAADLELARTLRRHIWQCRHPLLNRMWGRLASV